MAKRRKLSLFNSRKFTYQLAVSVIGSDAEDVGSDFTEPTVQMISTVPAVATVTVVVAAVAVPNVTPVAGDALH